MSTSIAGPIRPTGAIGLYLIPGSFVFLSLVFVTGGAAAIYQRLSTPRVEVRVESCYPNGSCVCTWRADGREVEGVIDNAGAHKSGEVISATIRGPNGDTLHGYIAGGIAMIVIGLLFLLYLPYWFRQGRPKYVAKGMRL